ncbi:uncharacterized protein LOC124155755 [Ischnura elegans]|uniref:uncharacterized protein LOC124155755 n=1 Tax=Ischnura elegans TaxID=197161 RepID=UPI001ED8BB4D|nr:uncharacterized protein LOC124155755 [Ischnura elegans]
MANSDVVAHEQSAKVPQDHGKPAEVARQLFNLHPLLRAPPDIGDIHLCTHSESVEEAEENSSTSTGRQSVAFATRSGDLFLLKTRRGESPLVKRVPWYLDPERAIVALTFDPSGSWLLVIGSDASFSLVPVLTVISGTSAGVVSRHGWATRDITSFPPPPRQDAHHPLHPTCVTWWENTQWGPVAVLGGDRGEVLFVDLATGTSVGSTTITGPVKSLHLCHNNKLDSIFLLITNSNREQWKLLLEQRDKGYYWPLDRVDSSSPLTRGPPLLPTRSRLQGLKQLSVEKISLIKQKLAETRKTGAGSTMGSLRDPHGLEKTSCEDGVPYERSASLITPEKLGLHVGETFICPQNSRGSHLLSGYYAPSNLLTVHSMELEVVPLSIHRLPPFCHDVLLTDRFIFVTDHSSVTLTVISCQLSESSIEDSTEYNPESVIQKFSFSGGERVVGLFKKTAVGGGQERTTSLRGGGGGVKRGTPPVPIRSSQAAAATAAALADVNHLKMVEPVSVSGQWANGPPLKAREVTMGSVSVESKETDTCIVVTTCGVYELQLRQCPSELFLDLALKNGELEEAERVAQVFGLNLQHLLEVAGDLELASKSFTQAISFYKLSRCRHLKSVLKFAAGGHSVELLGFIETVFGASSAGTGGKDLSPSERIHLSNLAVMAHVERVLRSAAASAAATTAQNAAPSGAEANNAEPSRGRTYSSSLLGKFLRFLHDNQHYDEVLAVSVVGQTALWEPLRFLCSQRGLHREALTSLSRLLQSVAASRSNDGGGTEPSQSHSHPFALTSVAASLLDPSLWECLSDEALLQPLLERPQLATVHLNFVTSFLSMLSAPSLQRLAVLYDPSSPIFSPSMQRLFSCDTQGQYGFKVSSAGSESLEDSGVHHPIEELLEMYIKVMLYLSRKRSGGRASYFPELMGWSISKERDAGDDCDEKKKKPAERGRPPSILAAGYAHAALVWNRGVLTWGNTAHGCLGHGPTMSRYSFPRDVASFPSLGIEVLSVSCGRQHTLALTTNGVYAWGSAQFGQIGIGMSSGQAPYPRLVESLCREQVVQVSAGQYHSMALTDDGRVYTWGWGVYGQLGHGNVEDCTVPTLVQALNGSVHITSICGGHCHSLALAVGGQLMAWGSSVFGQLGHGAVGKSSLPVCVSLPEPVSIVATAYFHNLAVGISNRLYTWGSSPQVLRLQAQAQKKARLKQLVPLSPQPPPTEGRKPSRVEAPGGSQAQGEAGETGEGVRVALDDVGARSGGSSSSSESADGESQAHLLPSVVDTSLVLGPITQVSCGCHHSALLTKDGTVYTWGRSLDGQVGNGTRREASIPAPLSCPPPPPSAPSAPSTSNGNNGASNSSNNTTLPILTRLRASHVTCGCEFTLALEATSEKLWAWGSNSLAQLGKDLDEDPRSALHGKVVMLKANKRVIKWPQGAQNSSDLPYLVPWLPPAVPLTDAEAKKGWASRKVVIPSGRDDDTAPYGRHALHKALEFFHGHYSSQRLLSCCLELENYQAASKIMALDRHFHQALAYQLKALYLARSSDASSPLDRGTESCRKKTRRVEQESEGSQKRRRDAKATSVPLYNGTSGGCLRCETHSFAIQGGEEEMSEVGTEGCHACGQEAGAKEDLVPEDDDAGSSPLLSASISPEVMGGEGAQPVGESPQPSPSPTPPLLWGGGVVDGDGGEELARQASSVVEHYASLLEEEGHQMVRRLLEQGIDFWLAHSLPLGSLESLLVKHMSKFFYPLGLMLFCDGGRSDCGTADDRRKGGGGIVGGCARGEDGEKVSSVRGRGTTAMGGGSNILSQLSTRFCLQLCSTLLSHIQHKKVAYPEYVELLAQVMAMQAPLGTSRDNGDGVQVAVGDRVLPYDVAPEHAMEAVLENLPSLIGDEAIHVAGDAVSDLLLGNGQAGNNDDNVVTGKGSAEALVFSCGHHFHADRFRQSVLPETELALLGLHHPLPRTARLVKGLFSVGVGQKHSSLQLACPNCVLSHLQAQV